MLQKFRAALAYLLPFLLGGLLFALLMNHAETTAWLGGVWADICFVLSRFLIGFALAYLLNFPFVWLQRKLKLPKFPAILLVQVFLLSICAVLLLFVVPAVADAAGQILGVVRGLPQYPDNLTAWLAEHFPKIAEDELTAVHDVAQTALSGAQELVMRVLNFQFARDALGGVTRSVLNILVGWILSVYMLIERKSIARVTKNLIYALFKSHKADRLIEAGRLCHRTFKSYLGGMLTKSLVVLVLSLILYGVFRIPQTPFLAILAGVTTLVPFFGPIIGGVLTVLILLFYSPTAALTAGVIVIAVQVLDGYVIGPRILGESVGISPFLTIAAILLGGDLFGFAGIFLGVPTMAVIKTLFYDRYLAKKLYHRALDTGGLPEGIAPPPYPPPPLTAHKPKKKRKSN